MVGRIRVFRFDSDDLYVGSELFEGEGNSGDESTTTDGDEDGFAVRGKLLMQFDSNGSLPCDDVGIVIRMDEYEVFVFGYLE